MNVEEKIKVLEEKVHDLEQSLYIYLAWQNGSHCTRCMGDDQFKNIKIRKEGKTITVYCKVHNTEMK